MVSVITLARVCGAFPAVFRLPRAAGDGDTRAPTRTVTDGAAPGDRPRSPELVALEHVGGGGAYDGAEPDDDRDLPWYAALTSCTGCTGYY